jgi:thiamine-phosphate pyrophosphorylase
MTFVLYLVTDPNVPNLIEATERALSGAPPGSIAVELRDKEASASALAELARALLPICGAAGAKLLVNDRADVARAVGALGVHLPEAGLSIRDARAVLGDAIVARSCHDAPGLERAEREGADFATLGPIGSVPGKGPPIGVDGFGRAIAGRSLPIYALGGVDTSNARELIARGARGVAVIRAVYGSADPERAVRSLLAMLSSEK